MKIAILGTGMVGRTIGIKLHELGHMVTLGTRNVANTLANENGDAYGNPPFKEWHKDHQQLALAPFKEAVSDAELLFNCTGGMVSLSALEQIGEAVLEDKVLIDVANPLDFSGGMPPSLHPVNTDSLGEQLQNRFPKLKVVKALNTMNAQIMVTPGILEGIHHVFVCGNDHGAKKQTKEVLRSFGWSSGQILDLGDITNARGTEMLLPIWLRLWGALGTAEFNFCIQKNG
ncbi:MAG: NAD(P)-binding domain-containing protein [Bacteroidota bacterium]